MHSQGKTVNMVVAIYTGQGLSGTIETLFHQILPECRLVNLIDDGMIHEVIQADGVTKAVSRRLIQYYQMASDMGADVILNTCSSVGEVVEVGRTLIDVPIVRIDEAMAEVAAKRYHTVGVLGTVNTTLKPTVRLLTTKAEEAGKTISIVEGLAEGAYTALIKGNPEEHDRLILETANKIAGTVDGIVLAQGSMSRMEEALKSAIGKDVLSSPPLALKEVEMIISRKRKKHGIAGGKAGFSELSDSAKRRRGIV